MPIKGQSPKQVVHTELHKFKHRELHSGSKHGPLVRNRKQAIAIALSEARKVKKKADGGGDLGDQGEDEVAAPKGDKLPVAAPVDWSKLNQPMGSITPTTPTPTERVGNYARNAMVDMGANPQVASHLTEGVGNILQATPLGIPASVEDFMEAKNKGDYLGASIAGLGFLPGVGPEAKAVAKGFTKKGAEIAQDIHHTVLDASAWNSAAHPDPGDLAKALKSYYPKDIAASAYYLGLPEGEVNNLKSYMSQGAQDAFDKHYGKMGGTQKAKAPEAAPAPAGSQEQPVPQTSTGLKDLLTPEAWEQALGHPYSKSSEGGISARQFHDDSKIYDANEAWPGYDTTHVHLSDQPLDLNLPQKGAVGYWTDPKGYKDINGHLRGAHDSDKAANAITHLDTAMANSPLQQDMSTWRGLHGPHAEELQKLKEGDTFWNAGYTATTVDPRRATHYGLKDDPGIILNYHMPAGSPSLYTSHPNAGGWSQNERELLLPHGQNFKIIGTEKIKAPIWDYSGNVKDAQPHEFTVYHVAPVEEAEGAHQLDAVKGAPFAPQPAKKSGPEQALGPEGWGEDIAHNESAVPQTNNDFPAALHQALAKKAESQGGTWNEVLPVDNVKNWVKNFDVNKPELASKFPNGTGSKIQTIQAMAYQPLGAVTPEYGLKANKIKKLIDDIPTKDLTYSLSTVKLNKNHVENILSYLSPEKQEELKGHLADELGSVGYKVSPETWAKSPAAKAEAVIKPHLKPIEDWPNWRPMEYKTPQVNFGFNDPEKLKKLGFNPNVLHWKGGNFPQSHVLDYPREIPDVAQKPVEPALFTAHDKAVASAYGPAKAPYIARAQKAFEVNWGDVVKEFNPDALYNDGTAHYDGDVMDKIVKIAKKQGADLVAIHNIHDVGGQGAHTQYAVINPAALRAPHAAFHPEKLHLRYPLAGLVGGGILGYNTMSEQGDTHQMKDGGPVKKRHKQIDEDPQDHEFINFAKGGMIDSSIPGRTDKIPMRLRPGSYVLPADIPSALGEGNSKAGAEILKKMFTHSAYGLPPPHVHSHEFHYPHNLNMHFSRHKAHGGKTDDHVPIIAAGGEYIIHPDVVKAVGGGDLSKGHKVLDKFVIHTRKQHIKTLRKLKPPK